MSEAHWPIISNRSEVKRFINNDKSIEGFFKNMFIEANNSSIIRKRSSINDKKILLEIDMARKINKGLLSKGWRKTKVV